MFRFTMSTCGILAEVAALQSSAPPTALVLSAAGILVAGVVWWSDARSLVDRIVGLDL